MKTTKPIPEPEQTMTLAETSGILRRLAEVEIRYHGVYYCMVDGKRTKITKEG